MGTVERSASVHMICILTIFFSEKFSKKSKNLKIPESAGILKKIFGGELENFCWKIGKFSVSIHIMCTEALRASLPIICEFDTLQNH